MRLLPWEYGVRNLGRSVLRSALTIGGSALVVLLIFTAGAFVRGMEKSLGSSAEPRNVIVLGAGSEESLERSEIDAGTGSLILAAVPGLASRLGVSYVSPEVLMQAPIRTERAAPNEHLGVLRGVGAEAFLVHTKVRILEGRPPEPGREELMVGRLAAAKMGLPDDRLAIGQSLWLDERAWTIMGRFEAPGTVMDAEIWLPLRDLQIAARRNNLSSVVLTLDSADFSDIDLFCKQRLDLELVAISETEYYDKLVAFYRPIRYVVWTTAALVAIGGVLGWLNTLFAAFAARIREFGTLQALGFPRRAVVVSLIQESMFATVGGTLVAAGLAVGLLDGVAVRFSMGAFGLTVDSTVLFWGMVAGVVLGIVGTLPPAWRCLRTAIPEALKSDV